MNRSKRAHFEQILHEVSPRALKLHTQDRAQSRIFGDRQSGLTANEGIEFAGLREAMPSDGARRINWRASARAGVPIVTQREPTREIAGLVLFDLTPSMFLRRKPEIAFGAAALIMQSALRANMPLGLWAVGGEQGVGLAPKTGHEHFRRATNLLIDALCGAENGDVPRRNLEDVFGSFRRLPRGSFLFVISDFLDPRDTEVVITARNELGGYAMTPVIVQDEREYSFPNIDRALLSFEDVESGELRDVWIGKAQARQMRKDNERRFELLCQFFRNRNIFFAHLKSPDIGEMVSSLQSAL